jgi:hypothetical protein
VTALLIAKEVRFVSRLAKKFTFAVVLSVNRVSKPVRFSNRLEGTMPKFLAA